MQNVIESGNYIKSMAEITSLFPGSIDNAIGDGPVESINAQPYVAPALGETSFKRQLGDVAKRLNEERGPLAPPSSGPKETAAA